MRECVCERERERERRRRKFSHSITSSSSIYYFCTQMELPYTCDRILLLSYLILPCLTQHIKQKKKVFRFVSRFLLKKKIFFFSLFLHSTPFFRITYIFRYIIDRTRHIMSSKNDEMDVVFKQSEKTQSEATCRGTVRERNRSRRRK